MFNIKFQINENSWSVKKSLLVLISSTVIAGCGGGSSTSGSASENNNSQNAINGKDSISGSDTVDLMKFWDEIILSGYAKKGVLTGYRYKDFLNEDVLTNIEKVNEGKGFSSIRVKHIDHGAHDGDELTLSGLGSQFYGLSKNLWSKPFKIYDTSHDSYLIDIPVVLKITKAENLTVNLKYKYKDCKGEQTAIQYPLDLNSETVKFNSINTHKTTFVVTTKLDGCSPQESEFTTYKHYLNKTDWLVPGVKLPLVGQSILGGALSIAEDEFFIPNGLLKSGSFGTVGVMKNYTNASKREIQGKTIIAYEILPHTAQSVFVKIESKTYDASNNLINTIKDYYGKSDAGSGQVYNLIETVASYNNAAKTEVHTVYSPSSMDTRKALYSGVGEINGTKPGTQNWFFIPIDVKDFKAGGEIQIVLNLGNGSSMATYDLFSTKVPEIAADGRPVASLVNAYDVAPGTKTILKYKFPPNSVDIYYLGVEGSWFSAVSDKNNYTYSIWVD